MHQSDYRLILKNKLNKTVSAIMLSCGLALSTNIHAQSPETTAEVSLPSPLSLTLLLDKYAAKAPAISLQNAQVDFAKATLDANQSPNQWQANIDGRLGFREFAKQEQDHNLLALHIGKVIYDFERLQSQQLSDEAKVEQQYLSLKASENRQRLQVVKAYLNVVLADFQYRIDNEAMAIEYVGFDKKKDKHLIGQISDVDLLAAEQEYQAALVGRMKAEQAQFATRIELANVIGLPNARPDELKFPDLTSFKKRSVKGVSLESLQQQVLKDNIELQALKQAQQAQVYAIQKAQNLSSPTLRGDAWLGKLSSHPEVREGSWKAALSIDVPLYDGGQSVLATKQAQAQLALVNAQVQQLEQQLRSQVASIYFQLTLLKAEYKQHQLFGDYADLYLDLSRALYENESATDLGDSMVRLSKANYQMVAWEFKQALLWLELDYLTGQQVALSRVFAPAQNLKTANNN